MNKTTLILGAGFSIPYGYPSGEKLIKDLLFKDPTDTEHYSEFDLKELQNAIKANQAKSIDKFLLENSKYEKLGKKLIAEELLSAEKRYLTKRDNPKEYDAMNSDDLIKLILNSIDEEDFEKYNIITFNYDRHLEYVIYEKLYLKHQDVNKALKCLSKLKIIHVHGRMIPFEHEDINVHIVSYGLNRNDHNGFNMRNHKILTNKYINYAVDNIHTVYTNNSGLNEEVVKMIKEATRVFFLGFAYDELNMNLLGITKENAKLRTPYNWKDKTVAGTCLKIEKIDFRKIKRLFPFLKENTLINTTCKNLFMNYYSLTNPEDDVNPLEKKASCCEMNAHQEFTKDKEHVALINQSFDFKCLTCDTKNIAFVNKDAKGTLVVKNIYPKA